jgi:predicted FMN-binding regulatory protein PaiB
MIPANSSRYLMAATPFAVYFAAQAISAIPLPRKLGPWLAAAMMALLVLHHATQMPLARRATQKTNATVAVADGPESAYVQPAWAAIRRYTHVNDVVGFWRVRALTLYTDRRGVQSSNLQLMDQQADFFMMRRNSTFFQPQVSDTTAAELGWRKVWEDTTWVLWQVRQPLG